MTKWEPYAPTIYTIMSRIDEEEKTNAARMLWRNGIEAKYEFNYYFDCLMWVINHTTVADESEFKDHYGYTDLGEHFGISNGRVFVKIKGKFKNNYIFDPADKNLNMSRQDSPFESLWAKMKERCIEEQRQPITSKDGAVIKELMASPWGWHIQFVFDYLGYFLEPKEELSPFERGQKLTVLCPKENAECFGYEFFTKEQQQKQKAVIGGKEFSIIAIWLALKIMKAATANKRSLGIYTHSFADGDQQSYLKIMADENECYICGETEKKKKC